MKRILSYLLLLAFFTSCEITYNGDVKIVTKGTVLHSDGTPVVNQDIKLSVYKKGGSIPFLIYISSEENFIGKTKTDQNGNYIMAIPEPELGAYSEIIVKINNDENELNSKIFRNINDTNYINHECFLPNVILYEKDSLSTLNLTVNQVSSVHELIDIEYLGAVANEIHFINPSEDYSVYNNYSARVMKNQTVTLRYTLKNHSSGNLEVNDVQIPIDNADQIEYTLEF